MAAYSGLVRSELRSEQEDVAVNGVRAELRGLNADEALADFDVLTESFRANCALGSANATPTCKRSTRRKLRPAIICSLQPQRAREPADCGCYEVLAVFGESELVAFAFVE